MNRNAFAIFIAAVMVFSAFAGMILMGGDQSQRPTPMASESLDTFGVQGRLVDWNFESLSDMLEMSPEDTGMAYWLNLTASENLTDAARTVLPQSFGLTYGGNLYPTDIQRLGSAYFNDTWVEFHWIRPFRLGYDGLVVPYEGYMMIPTNADYAAVMGRPTLFGTQPALEGVLDVISGGLPTDRFILPEDEMADLQVAVLGGASGLPVTIGNGYQELYVGVSKTDEGYNLTAKYLRPDADTVNKADKIAGEYGLIKSAQGDVIVLSGTVASGKLQEALMAFFKL